ncbi:MAG: DUF1015 domain-containing protein [Clostridia bacterium]
MKDYSNSVGVKVPELLLPNPDVDMAKWAVVACDQYTSQPDYWKEAERIVGDSPSALRLMLPEMYLDKPDEAQRILDINAHMKQYVEDGTLVSCGEGFVLVRRTTNQKTRTGLILALDLEEYDYTKGAKTLIRATEGTIVERIPPRLRIRKDAPLEMPHILVLIDDPMRTVIEPIAKDLSNARLLYDFELMQNGGHIDGHLINDEDSITAVLAALKALADPERFASKYVRGEAPMLFAMGDGNHSFATAKANWEEVKKNITKEQQQDHPARYCMVEIENVHDNGIVFEPIHRVIFGIESVAALNYLKGRLDADNGCCEIRIFTSSAERDADMGKNADLGAHELPFVAAEGFGYFRIQGPASQLPVGTLQRAIDAMMREFGGTVDYIHGENVVNELGSKPGNIGFLLPPMDKSDLFATVIFDGALPRKTFSMGEANEKRYYLECRSINR